MPPSSTYNSWAKTIKKFFNKINGNAQCGGTGGNDCTANAQRMWNSHLLGVARLYNSFYMSSKKNEAGNLLPMTVTEGVTVNVLPHEQYEYLMTTKEVAIGYGTSTYAIQQALHRNGTELIEGKHFTTALTICQSDLPSQLRCAHNAILWTKRGIVRLGFFIKSERAKLFRDWAEELVIGLTSPQTPLHVERGLPRKTKANRLTSERLIDIMADVCRIDDRALRLSITDKLMGGRAL